MSDKDIFQIKRDSTSPSLVRELLDGEGNPLPMSEAAKVYFSMGTPEGLTHIYRAACEILPDGRVQYDWQPGDTSITARFEGEFIVEWSGGEEQYVPSNGFVVIQIGRNIRPKAVTVA